MKRKTALFLAALLILAAASCGEAAPSGATSDTTASTDTSEPVEEGSERERLKDPLPANLRFDGETVTIYCKESSIPNLVPEEETGDIVSDALYARNMATEERLGVKLDFITIPGSNGSEVGNQMKADVLAGDDGCDFAVAGQYYTTPKALEGVFYNLLNVDHITYDAPWYQQDFVKAATIYDTMFYITGDLSITASSSSYVTFYNKNLAAEWLPKEDLYQTVWDGKWTLDHFSSLLKDIYRDLNGNSERDAADFYGYAMALTTSPLDALLPGSGIHLVELNADGDPEITLNSEKTVNLYEKINALCNENTGTFTAGGTADDQTNMFNKFMQSETVFHIQQLGKTTALREFNDPYGILPIPKYDEAQERYYTIPHDQFAIMVVPSNSANPELAGAVIEYMNYDSYKRVTPAYFEVAMKVKYLDDNADAQMFDLIMEGKGFDLGVILSNATGNLSWCTRKVMQNKQEFSSWYASVETSSKAQLESAAAALKDLSGK